jgi:hypothetical protein
VSVFEFPAVNQESFEICFKIAKKLRKILYHCNVVPFIRSSSSVPLLLSSIYNYNSRIVLIGYDGTGGMPEETYAYSENSIEITCNSEISLDKKRIISNDYFVHPKNINSNLHSTNNPAYGSPTLSQILSTINMSSDLLVSSNTSLFSKFLSVSHIPEEGMKFPMENKD